MTNVRKSVTVFSQTVDLIFDGTYSDEVMNTVVLSTTNSVLKGYIEKFYPDSKVIEVSSSDECIAAVKSGRATSTIMNRYKTSRYLHKTANQSLHSTGLPNLCNISFVVRSTDVELLSLLNRGILVMGDKKIDSSVNRYIYYDYDYSWSNFVAEHMQESILLLSCFIAFLLAIFIFYINSTRRNQRRMELAQSEIQRARDLLAGALEKAEFANASKSTFLFNMSHDIRTPMNAILGFADLLEKYDDEPKKRREYVANIRTAGGYLLSLINEVLEMARIESGKVSLNEEAGNFLDMIDSLHVVLSEGYEKKNLQITRNINIQHPHVFYDFTKERAIFLNIMSNSLKYTPEGGRISLCIEELPGADDDHVVFRSVIQDTGIGMAKDFLPHIFESFSRERSATESRVTGTGLGMGIVKKYVDLMQGSIAVESEVGKGTTITLEIPHRIVHEAVASPDEQEADYSVLQGKSVLLAEDNELNREIAEELLKDAGMSVRSAADGIECISILTAEMPGTFDFILMDLQMPNMDGLKATAAIREIDDKAKASIPIIAMTANVFDADRKRAFAAGMDGFAGKPIQIEELKRELVRVLSENSQD